MGLSTTLLGLHDIDKALLKNVSAGLDFMPAGPFHHSATELIQSKAFSAFIQSLKDRYEYVIIDTPPTLLVPDSLSIASQVDRVVVVGRCNSTRVADFESTIRNLVEASGKRVHVVLNFSGRIPGFYYARKNRSLEESTDGPAGSDRESAA